MGEHLTQIGKEPLGFHHHRTYGEECTRITIELISQLRQIEQVSSYDQRVYVFLQGYMHHRADSLAIMERIKLTRLQNTVISHVKIRGEESLAHASLMYLGHRT